MEQQGQTPANSKTKKFLKGTLILTISSIVVKVIGALNWVILSRVMGGEGIGLYQMGFPIYLMAITVSSAGIPVAISIITAEKVAKEDYTGAGVPGLPADAVLHRAVFFPVPPGDGQMAGHFRDHPGSPGLLFHHCPGSGSVLRNLPVQLPGILPGLADYDAYRLFRNYGTAGTGGHHDRIFLSADALRIDLCGSRGQHGGRGWCALRAAAPPGVLFPAEA